MHSARVNDSVDVQEQQLCGRRRRRPKLVNAVLGACWACGQSSDYHGCSMLPNGLASLRLLASGEVTWILFSLMDLVPCLRTWWGKDDISTTALLDFVAKSTEKDWMEIGEPLGVAGYWVTQKAGEVLQQNAQARGFLSTASGVP